MNPTDILRQLDDNDRTLQAGADRRGPVSIVVSGWDFQRNALAYPIGRSKSGRVNYAFVERLAWYCGWANDTVPDGRPYVGVWRKATRAERLRAGARTEGETR